MRGRFTAVTHGVFETDRRIPRMPFAGLALAAALIGWLLTVLWLAAAFLAAVVLIATGGLVAIHRWNRRATAQFMERSAVLAQSAPKPAPTAPAVPALTVNHFHGGTHLHFGAGAADPRFIQAIPVRDAITTEETE
jgi:hypothetical protein